MRCIRPPHGTMRTFLFFGRQGLRQGFPKSATASINRASTRPFASGTFIRQRFATPRFRGRTILWSSAAGGAILSPLAFVGIANEKSGDGEQTHEGAMLEASRKELEEQVPKSLKNSRKYRRGIYFFVEDYIIEPIATGFRFLHLIIIFVPVIATIPAIWLGQRQANKDNERSGTIWWYGFLVSSMERAGAAFIKARDPFRLQARMANRKLVGTMGSLKNRCLSHPDVSHHVHSPLKRARTFAQSV
jgi:aarF domain-containing kinase